jgi:methyltransferase (TIGR00027 family)
VAGQIVPVVNIEKPATRRTAAMDKKRSSTSAQGVAASRAIESMRPDHDRVIFDPYARLFLGPKFLKWIDNPIRQWLLAFMGNLKFPGYRGSIIARVRYMNECIKACFPDEFGQLVILGAGYDMSAFCFKDLLTNALVFEVDHPETQKDKLDKLRRHIENIPGNITYVPVDLETGELKKSLLNSGYDPSAKTLFIWEGVTQYLEKESVEQTLKFIGENAASGSKLAFDYFPPEVVDGTSTDKLARELRKLVAKNGEPFKFGVKADDMENYLKRYNFVEISHSSAPEIRDAYFHGDNKRRKVSDLFRFVCAEK